MDPSLIFILVVLYFLGISATFRYLSENRYALWIKIILSIIFPITFLASLFYHLVEDK